MSWLDSITDSVNMNFSKLWEIAEDRGAWHATVHGVAKSQTQLGDWTTFPVLCPQSLSFPCPSQRWHSQGSLKGFGISPWRPCPKSVVPTEQGGDLKGHEFSEWPRCQLTEQKLTTVKHNGCYIKNAPRTPPVKFCYDMEHSPTSVLFIFPNRLANCS